MKTRNVGCLFVFWLLSTVYCFGQSKTYFHDRVDTTIYATTTGTNAYTGTNTDPNFNVAAYMRGLMVSTFIVNGNTGACTYRLVTRTGALAAVAIKKQNGAALVAGDIPDSTAVLLLYYGSFWRLEGIYTTATSAWSLTGNAGTTAGTNFLGTTDAIDLVFKTNNTEKARVSSAGVFSLGLASTNNGSLLFRNSTNANTLTINSGVTSASHSWTLPLAQGAANTALANNGSGVLSWSSASGIGGWDILGNAGTVAGTNFVGTTDNVDIVFKRNSVEQGRFATTNGFQVTSTGNTSATFSEVQLNSVGTELFKVRSDAYISAGLSSGHLTIGLNSGFNPAIPANTFVGVGIGAGVITNGGLTAVGYKAFEDVTSAQNSCAFGSLSLTNLTTGGAGVGENNAYGVSSLTALTTGFRNNAFGFEALMTNISGQRNNAFGWRALYLNTASDNTAMGHQALLNSTADENTAIGSGALASATSGLQNTAIGVSAGFTGTGAHRRIAIGYGAGFYETSTDAIHIDNRTRASEAAGRIEAWLYGEASATVANQIFRPNAQYQGTQMHNNANLPSGTTYNFIASGTYTPTVTDSANTSARTAYKSQWERTGNVVSVSGVVDVDPTLTATSTIIKITLPIPSNFTAVGDCRGTAFCANIAGQGAAMLETTAYAVSDFVIMKWVSGDITNQPMSYTFIYEVK